MMMVKKVMMMMMMPLRKNEGGFEKVAVGGKGRAERRCIIGTAVARPIWLEQMK